MTKNTKRVKISPILDKKIMKFSPCNCTHQGLLAILRCYPQKDLLFILLKFQ